MKITGWAGCTWETQQLPFSFLGCRQGRERNRMEQNRTESLLKHFSVQTISAVKKYIVYLAPYFSLMLIFLLQNKSHPEMFINLKSLLLGELSQWVMNYGPWGYSIFFRFISKEAVKYDHTTNPWPCYMVRATVVRNFQALFEAASNQDSSNHKINEVLL